MEPKIKKFTCETFNITYMLECKKCSQKYIGTSERQLKYRLADHRGYVTNQVISRAMGLTSTCQATAWQIYLSPFWRRQEIVMKISDTKEKIPQTGDKASLNRCG